MNNIFITKIFIKKIRHLQDVEILLSEKEKKHLILTGKNGCGKTSVLDALNLNQYIHDKQLTSFGLDLIGIEDIFNISSILDNKSFRIAINSLDTEKVSNINDSLINNQRWFFNASRSLFVNKSEGVKDKISDKVEDFEKYLAKKRTEQAFLSFEKAKISEVKKISDWFDQLEKSLKFLFEDENLTLQSNRTEDKISFFLRTKGREDFDFNTLSSGYSSVLSILFEMMQKMQSDGASFDYKKSGIAIIDEVEAHLHVSLQKKILPFLTKFFPNVQFIVSTHSPFILQSLKDTVIYDLETKKRYENFSDFSSETILETFYDIDKFSDIIKEDMLIYENLLKNGHTIENKDLILKKRNRFYKIQDIEINYWVKDLDLKYKDKIKTLLIND